MRCMILDWMPNWTLELKKEKKTILGQPTKIWPVHLCSCLVAQSCPTLCDPMDCSQPGSSYGISQAWILEWCTIFLFPTQGANSHLLTGRWILYCWATRETQWDHSNNNFLVLMSVLWFIRWYNIWRRWVKPIQKVYVSRYYLCNLGVRRRSAIISNEKLKSKDKIFHQILISWEVGCLFPVQPHEMRQRNRRKEK